MELHQLLRHIRSETAICLFDIEGICICQVGTKEDISIELYDYNVQDLSTGISYVSGHSSCLYITIEK